MKNKQIIGLVVAGIVFVFVCASSVLVNSFTSEIGGNSFFDLMGISSSEEGEFSFPANNFIAVVRVEGVIMESETTSLFETATYYHQNTLDYINALISNDANKGIMLYVNSPGGTVTASDELYLKLLEYKEITNRPVYTYMASEACSGGYYISMASDYIMANRNTWTGSIGVIISLTNYKELYDKLGIKEINITSGANKAMGSSGEDMTEEQKAILQSLVDESYDQFVEIVADGRNMEVSEVKEAADGRIFSAKQAKDQNLIDEVVLTYEDAEGYVNDQVGPVVFHEPSNEATDSLSYLFGKLADGMKSRSDAEVLAEFVEKQGSGVPMYYAKP